MTGRVIIVTGASSGIGFEAARYLAEGGNDVVLACRCKDKGDEAVRKIREQLPNCLVQYMQLDLSSTSSIKDFVHDFTKKKKKLSVLINNAGMALNFKDLSRKTTNEGFEVTMATNHLGPFLLTNLLLDYLIQTASIIGDSRVINVTCALHDHENNWITRNCTVLETDNFQLQKENTFNGLQAYKNSKLCNILFTNYLAEKLRGNEVLVSAIDPGVVPTTQLNRNASKLHQTFSICCLHNLLSCTHMTKSVKKAARDVTDLAISDKYEGRTGKFFRDGVEDRSSVESYDTDLQREVWRISCQLVNFKRGAFEEGFDEISLG